MPDIVDWSDFANQEGNNRRKDGIRNLRLTSGQSFNVRFVGNPLKFFKYFVAGKSAICSNPDTCPVRAKFNIEPNTRYAVNVLDRNEPKAENRLKLLEVPPSVLKPVVAWWKARKQDPGGKNGCDFNIDVTGQQKNTRYTVTPLDVTPFTEEEKEYIKANIYDLGKIFKPVPEDQIEERLFPKGGGTPAAASPAPAVSRGVDLPF